MKVITKCGRIKVNDLSTSGAYMPKCPPGGSWRINNQNQLQFYNPITESWYTLFVTGTVGAETLAIGEADVSNADMCGYMETNPSGGSWRVSNGNLQFYNPTTGLWHTLFVTGMAGIESLTIGAGET